MNKNLIAQQTIPQKQLDCVEIINKKNCKLKSIILSPQTKKQVEIKDIEKTAQNYNHWTEFFYNWKKETSQNQEQLLNHIEILNERILFLTETKLEEIKEKQRLLKLKQEKLNRKKKPVRDLISVDEFSTIINQLSQTDFIDARICIALLVMFVTGLRVDNVRSLKVKQVKDLFRQGNICVNLNKRGDKNHFIDIGTEFYNFIINYKTAMLTICKFKQNDNYAFTISTDLKLQIGRENFTKELNTVLKKASIKFCKTLSTHSLRATVISDLAQVLPVDKVKQYIGHKTAQSTLQYIRRGLTHEELEQAHKKRAEYHQQLKKEQTHFKLLDEQEQQTETKFIKLEQF